MNNDLDCVPLKQHYVPEGQGQCAKCEVDFYTAGRGEHYRHLCQSCEDDAMHAENVDNAECRTLANLVEQLQQCLDGGASAALVQEALREGRGLLARWCKEGRSI